jgi:hypothetical protein
MGFRKVPFVAAAAGLALALTGLVGARAATPAGDYSDPQYAYHDQDNMSRSTWRHTHLFTDPGYEAAFVPVAADTWLQSKGMQAEGLRSGRVYTGAGNALVGGSVGDPRTQNLEPDGVVNKQIFFLSRTGAKLTAHVWWNTASRGRAPGVVITTGSIQGHEHMYWWAAKALAARGFEVLTWDVQGQGDSEGTGHAAGDATPTTDGVPAQQNANFDQGTVDALEFFLSTPKAKYAPPGWSPSDVAKAQAQAAANGEQIDWVNPVWDRLDAGHLGIAGHSLGASAVSEVQQCADASAAKSLPICDGRRFPIKAVVAWDSLSTPANANGYPFVPAVPAMSLQADGYFMNPQPTTTAPNPDGHLAALDTWQSAGLPAYEATIRGGIHNEFIQVPYVSMGTRYGTDFAEFYTVAWLERYVAGDTAATLALVSGPGDDTDYQSSPLPWATAIGSAGETGLHNPWNAHHFSVNYRSAWYLPDAPKGTPTAVRDIRAWAGLSAVGDWTGANQDLVDSELPAGPPAP